MSQMHSPAAQRLGQECALIPSLRKPQSCALVCQQHLCPGDCGIQRVSLRTPQSFPLTEIAGSEHKHCHLSLPPHVSHQPGMVSSPSIHHTGFLWLSLQAYCVSPSPSPGPGDRLHLEIGGKRKLGPHGHKLRAGNSQRLSPATHRAGLL